MIIRVSYCPSHPGTDLCTRDTAEARKDMYAGVVAMFICIIFLMFVSVMVYDQLTMILENTSGIDKLKGLVFEKRSARENLEDVFG